MERSAKLTWSTGNDPDTIEIQLALRSDGSSLLLKRRGIFHEPAAQEERHEPVRGIPNVSHYVVPVLVMGDSE